jgi:hypothetical protein
MVTESCFCIKQGDERDDSTKKVSIFNQLIKNSTVIRKSFFFDGFSIEDGIILKLKCNLKEMFPPEA